MINYDENIIFLDSFTVWYTIIKFKMCPSEICMVVQTATQYISNHIAIVKNLAILEQGHYLEKS